MNFKSSIAVPAISLAMITAAYAVDLEDTLINKTLNKTNSFISGLTNGLTESLLNTDRVKHLELDIQVQESSKPTFSLTNINKISEGASSAFFNQNTVSLHNDDQTVNFGLGYRNLIQDDKVMLGANLFFDYSFDDAHQRNGVGVEAISSVFDIRGNYYDATSGIQDISTGVSEEAMSGFDVRLDYHLPFNYNTRVFVSVFDFENGEGSFGTKGEKYGLSILANNLNFEIGYTDDNRTSDGTFANVSYTIPLGAKAIHTKKTDDLFEYLSVKHRMYEPVKRENKIKVVNTSFNVKASGF